MNTDMQYIVSGLVAEVAGGGCKEVITNTILLGHAAVGTVVRLL
jgi:hypothetical protein